MAIKTKQFTVEIREFNGTQFGERWDLGGNDNAVDTIEEFDEFVDQYVPIGIETEDEPARPFSGIVAGRQWTVIEPVDGSENEETVERNYSAFMRKIRDE